MVEILRIAKKLLKKSALFPLYQNWRATREKRRRTKLHVTNSFPAFAPHSAGKYEERAELTIQAINRVFPALTALTPQSRPPQDKLKEEISRFLEEEDEKKAQLGRLFSEFGSDKATTHNYHLIYGGIIGELDAPKKIFEIGLGTNSPDVVSTMGRHGKPGASLRAFREFVPGVEVYGADIDERVLFDEARIQTFFLDQTRPESFEILGSQIGSNFDLMIDDGLHSPEANLNSLTFFTRHVKVGGFIVLEDLHQSTESIWSVVSSLIEERFHSAFVETKSAAVFVAQRKQ